MYLARCCAACRTFARRSSSENGGLGAFGVDDVAIQIASHFIVGALEREAHKRAKQQAWEAALQRIPEDDFIDYAAYVEDQPDLYEGWRTGSWHTGRGATLPEFGLIHIREFGPRAHIQIKVLRPGPRPDPGPTNGFATGWPTQVLRKLKPLANPIPRVEGVNVMPLSVEQRQANRRAIKLAQRRGDPYPITVQDALGGDGWQKYMPLLVLAAGGAVLYFMNKR